MKPERGAKLEASKNASHAMLDRWLPVVIQIWLTVVLVSFVVIRVLGSNTAQVLLRKWGAR